MNQVRGAQALTRFQEKFLDSGKLEDIGKELGHKIEMAMYAVMTTFGVDIPQPEVKGKGGGLVSEMPSFQTDPLYKEFLDKPLSKRSPYVSMSTLW